MNTVKLYFTMLAFRLIPDTRLFEMKNKLLRWCGARIGNNVEICSSITIMGCGRLSVGDNVWIGHQCFISSSSQIQIGNHVDIAPQVYIGTGTHTMDRIGLRSAGKEESFDIEIGDGVWLGARCLILPGVTIGEKAVVAAGAVVTQDIPPRCMVAGVPAIIKKKF